MVTTPTLSSDDSGFTIIEIVVAMVILLVGVLAMLTFVTGSLSSTRRTTAREQGTSLAREVVERSRQSLYSDLTPTAAPGLIQASVAGASALQTNVATPTAGSFTVTRRGVIYTVTVSSCSIDDPSDGVGQGNATFCLNQGSTTVPGSSATTTAASVNVLGIAVAVGGSLLGTVCSAVGTNATIISRLTGTLSAVAPISACTSTGTSSAPYDSRPDDLRRVRADVTWTADGKAGSLSQTTLLTNPLPNDCPLTTPVAPATLPAGCPTPLS